MGKKMDAALKRLREMREKNLQGGGPKHIERQHGRGKLTARERIDFFLDPGTFSELGSFVNATSVRIDGKETDAPCDGAVIGTGEVDGRPVAVYASDFTILGGSVGCQHATKFIRLIDMAAAWRIPMVWLLDSSGGRLGYTDVPMAGLDWWFALQSRYSGLIPQINVLMGPCIAGQAYCPVLCDFLLMSRETAHLWLGGPRMTQAATSETIGDNVGGADYHMQYSGTCDVVGADDKAVLEKTRELLSYLPSNFREKPPATVSADKPDREVPQVTGIVPEEYDIPYDMHDLIRAIVDDGRYYEIKENYARQVITCFCRFDGAVAGVVASNPSQPGTLLDVDACDKYYRFLQALDAYNIPLVTLTDTPPAVPGQDQEEKGLLRHFGKILDTYVAATIPKINVIIREAYGDAGGMVMGMVKGIGVDLTYAWPVARMAVEAGSLDYRKVYGKGVEEDAYEGYLNRSREKIDVFEAAGSWSAQIVDEIIEPKDTRKKIIEALAITGNKHERHPGRAKQHSRTGPT